MSKTAKAEKATTPKPPAAPRERVSYVGRSAAIHKAAAEGLDKDAILARIKKRWPDTTPKVIADVTSSEARKAAKKSKKEAAAPKAKAKATPPALKKPAAKKSAPLPPPPAPKPVAVPEPVAAAAEGFQAGE